MVVETVTASEVSGDSANVDDVVPTVMSDTVVSVAERRYINIFPCYYFNHPLVSTR